MAKIYCYVIECRTGCSCCQYENHYRGFFRTEEDARKRIKFYRYSDGENAYWPLASQYSRRGNYDIKKILVEYISEDRIILNNSVVGKKSDLIFIDVNEDGSIVDNEKERESEILYDLYNFY